MKESAKSVAQRQAVTSTADRSTAAGPKGGALQPPAYGIDLADRPASRRENRTGLPDRLKDGVEALSGLSMEAVRVHYNSPKPAALDALAYTQGSEIHVGPGQEGYLPHEAWHVVQQAQGRVSPTTQVMGVGVNDEAGLEMEADTLGNRATYGQSVEQAHIAGRATISDGDRNAKVGRTTALQRRVENLKFDSELKKTIGGVIKDKKLSEIYELPDSFSLLRENYSVARARAAEATISTLKRAKRGSSPPVMKKILALGKWEMMAASHIAERKAIDTGHLIADNFFGPRQKKGAYDPRNLTVQNAVFNEGTYKNAIENPIRRYIDDKTRSAGKTYGVKLAVKLAYDPDSFSFPIDTLVDRKAIKVRAGKDAKHKDLCNKKTILEVPRRMPTQWSATISAPKVAGKRIGDGKERKKQARARFKEKTGLGKKPLWADFDGGGDPYTSKRTKHTGKKLKYKFTQYHRFEDASGRRNPLEMFLGGGRWTQTQKTRATETAIRANKYKMIENVMKMAIDKAKGISGQAEKDAFLSSVLFAIYNIVSKSSGETKKSELLEDAVDVFLRKAGELEKKEVKDESSEDESSEDESSEDESSEGQGKKRKRRKQKDKKEIKKRKVQDKKRRKEEKRKEEKRKREIELKDNVFDAVFEGEDQKATLGSW